ncbi:MAG: helicase-associated domain-containing protein [Armatimonadetes bacterium]|nr:helicase-associated domain-containing protein [Armatimonadota bacterium]
MSPSPQNPLIVQSDRSVLLEVENPDYAAARDELARFAELVKSPEHVHTYRITPLSLWNAAAAGLKSDEMIEGLRRYSKYDLPDNLVTDVRDYVQRYGRVKLEKVDGALLLTSADETLLVEVLHQPKIAPMILERVGANALRIVDHERGRLKQQMIKIGWPVEDLAGYVEGTAFAFRLRQETAAGLPFHVRDYQRQSGEVFHAGGGPRGGSGVIVLPCGAGKTIVGMSVMEKVAARTLIIATNTVAVRQWISELLDKTDIDADAVGEYTGEKKEIRPITVTTYQCLTYHKRRSDGDGDLAGFPHLRVFDSENWGLIVYDEVHLLPAPIFRVTADIQARRRLGLTATLVREDGREDDVFSLIGPKKFDVPWKELEQQGWIAEAVCNEVRLPMTPEYRMQYAMADTRNKYRVAAENPLKLEATEKLINRHRNDRVLVIGQYLDQLDLLAQHFRAPLITGKMPNREREQLFEAFRRGDVTLLIVSKVANFSIDLPDANVAIQVSGAYGSRQEEAQRLGRILRPKSDGSQARFYTLVTRDTRDQDFAANRQLFLTEQGYSYFIYDDPDNLPSED